MDLPTLNSILDTLEIRSSKTSQRFNGLYKTLTIKDIVKIFESIFETQIKRRFEELNKKHKSCLSRELVTVVLDDSVFKQWLDTSKTGEDFGKCYSCFFSGQFKATTYGFDNCCIGIVIAGIYYPLYFNYIPKQKKEAEDKYGIKIAKAMNLVKRFSKFRTELKETGIDLGKLRISVDNGYSDIHLAELCCENDLGYISVPKKSHTFLIDGKKQTLSQWIEDDFLRLEKEHELKQSKLPKAQQKPFEYRFRAFYRSQNQSVILLAFRLNGSKKVSIIYTTEKSEMAKTMRRHWFQRTYIEQFFKIIKHVLKIQESRTKDKDTFTFKLLRFSFMAFHVQKLVKTVQIKLGKHMKNWQKKGFISIQRILRREQEFYDLLQSQFNTIV